MSEENREKVRRLFAGMDRGDVEVIEGLVAHQFVDHDPLPEMPEGREGLKALLGMMKAAFPDAQTQIVDMVVDGDKVAVRTQMRGTNRGEFMGMPATGKRVMLERMDIVRFEDGLIVEHWGLIDMPALLMLLGTMPEAKPPPGSS
jgi:steroid delta-isomerase-like uncharacterized protein